MKLFTYIREKITSLFSSDKSYYQTLNDDHEHKQQLVDELYFPVIPKDTSGGHY